MENLTDNSDENTKHKAAPASAEEDSKPMTRHIRAFPGIVKTGVRYALILSMIFFVLFMASSMYPPGVPDAFLFALLRLLRYSAVLLCVFSLVALGFGVHRSVHAPGVRNVLGILRYFFFTLLGAILVMFSLLIVAMVGGN